MSPVSRLAVPAIMGLLLAVCAGGPAAAEALAPVAARITAMQDKLLDPGSRIELDGALSDLTALEGETAPGSAERGRVEYLRGFLFWKDEQFGPAIEHDQAALAIDAAHPFLSPPERLHLEGTLGRMAEEEGKLDVAIEAYRRTLALVGADPPVTAEQTLALQTELAFCLHEAGRYAEARALNEASLLVLVKRNGPDSPKLLPVLNNLAQNEYELKDDAAAEATLKRLLGIATAAGDGEHADSALMQLGALSFENGHGDQARDFMLRRVKLAEASRNPRQLARARAALAILEDRMKEAAR